MSELNNGVDPETKNSINATVMHARICDLIHDGNMSASYQNLYFNDGRPQRVVREQIRLLL